MGRSIAAPLAAAVAFGAAVYVSQPAPFLWTTSAQADDVSQTGGVWLVQKIEGEAAARRGNSEGWSGCVSVNRSMPAAKSRQTS